MLPPDDCPRDDDEGIPPPDEPELEPLLEGMLDELPPERPEPPELPLDGPEEPEDPGGELDGLPLEEDCCSGHPPMRKAVTALNAQSRTAATGKRRKDQIGIVTPSLIRGPRADSATLRLNGA